MHIQLSSGDVELIERISSDPFLGDCDVLFRGVASASLCLLEELVYPNSLEVGCNVAISLLAFLYCVLVEPFVVADL